MAQATGTTKTGAKASSPAGKPASKPAAKKPATSKKKKPPTSKPAAKPAAGGPAQRRAADVTKLSARLRAIAEDAERWVGNEAVSDLVTDARELANELDGLAGRFVELPTELESSDVRVGDVVISRKDDVGYLTEAAMILADGDALPTWKNGPEMVVLGHVSGGRLVVKFAEMDGTTIIHRQRVQPRRS